MRIASRITSWLENRVSSAAVKMSACKSAPMRRGMIFSSGFFTAQNTRGIRIFYFFVARLEETYNLPVMPTKHTTPRRPRPAAAAAAATPAVLPARSARIIVPLSLPADLDSAVAITAEAIRMTKQETMRQAIHRGLPIVRDLLAITATAA